jgi:hypothetical protein
LLDPGDDIIEEETILQLAKNINQEQIYKDVFSLNEIAWDLDAILTIKKMEYLFTQREPIDEEYNMSLECLTEAHNQMLYYI